MSEQTDHETETELLQIIARCGFVANPTVTMGGALVNPTNVARLRTELRELFARKTTQKQKTMA